VVDQLEARKQEDRRACMTLSSVRYDGKLGYYSRDAVYLVLNEYQARESQKHVQEQEQVKEQVNGASYRS